MNPNNRSTSVCACCYQFRVAAGAIIHLHLGYYTPALHLLPRWLQGLLLSWDINHHTPAAGAINYHTPAAGAINYHTPAVQLVAVPFAPVWIRPLSVVRYICVAPAISYYYTPVS